VCECGLSGRVCGVHTLNDVDGKEWCMSERRRPHNFT
jgi:hypothetical protein